MKIDNYSPSSLYSSYAKCRVFERPVEWLDKGNDRMINNMLVIDNVKILMYT